MEAKVKAAELWAGSEGCICGLTAGAWWELDGIAKGRVEVFTTKRARCYPDLIAREPPHLGSLDVRIRKGVRVTAVERTLVDLAGSTKGDVLEAALHDALRKRITVAPRVRGALDRAGTQGRRGAAALKVLLEDVSSAMGFFGSRFEVIVRNILVADGLPPPMRQYPVTDGKRTIHPDLCYPEARLAIEADSFSRHGTKEAFYRDRDRDNFLRLNRWDVYRATWWDTKRPEDMLSFVRSVLFPQLSRGIS